MQIQILKVKEQKIMKTEMTAETMMDPEAE